MKINIHCIGFWLGIGLFLVMLLMPQPEGMSAMAARCGAVTALVAVWWMTQALPIPVTAFVPLILFPVVKVASIFDVSKLYINHYIFLFMGGFIIALAMERWQLHRRIALHILKVFGTNPIIIVLGFMCTTAYLSMWISNTATVLIIFPIALAVSSHMKDSEHDSQFTAILLLAVAYSASVGGLATPIGTPPNVLFMGMLPKIFADAPKITFMKWMLTFLPLSLVMLAMIWLFFVYRIRRLNVSGIAEGTIGRELDRLGPTSKEEKYVGVVFAMTALLWMFRENIDVEFMVVPGWSNLLGLSGYISDASVAMFMAFILFMIPAKSGKERLMDWETAVKLPWGMLILFGAGFAIAGTFQTSGLSHWIGNSMTAFQVMPPFLFILVVCLVMTFLTEVTSNTATASIILPILAATVSHADINPLLVLLPATLSASCAFMLPVATPPNMIVFATKKVPIREMIKMGVVINILGAILITLYAYFIMGKMF